MKYSHLPALFAALCVGAMQLIVVGNIAATEASEEEPATPPTEFEQLETSRGKKFEAVKVVKMEPDSLVIEHRDGMARVSLFDLSEEIQTAFSFDRDLAMAHYKKREIQERETRKQLFLERVRVEAQQAKEKQRENFDAGVRSSWIPVRARILVLKKGGALASVDRKFLVKTRSKTPLGGERLPGKPELKYSRLSAKPVFLRDIAAVSAGLKPGDFWHGYIQRNSADALAKRKSGQPLIYDTAKPAAK